MLEREEERHALRWAADAGAGSKSWSATKIKQSRCEVGWPKKRDGVGLTCSKGKRDDAH